MKQHMDAIEALTIVVGLASRVNLAADERMAISAVLEYRAALMRLREIRRCYCPRCGKPVPPDPKAGDTTCSTTCDWTL